MFTSVALLLYAVILLSFIYRYIVYPQYVSSLSKIPRAHPTSGVLPTWLWYQVRNKRESRSITDAHKKYGPVVLLSPTEVSVASLEGLKKLYSGRRFKRPAWSVATLLNFNNTKNLVTMTDINEHAKRKKAMLQVLAKSFIFRSADFHNLAAVILLERFLPVLSGAAKEKHGLDVYELLRAVAAEIGSAYEMGLQNGLDITREEHEHRRKDYLWHTNEKVQETKDQIASKEWLEAQMLEMCAKADADIKRVKTPNTVNAGESDYTYPLAYSHLEAATEADYPALSTSEKLLLVASELLDNLEASREGEGTILTYAMHELSQRPMHQRQLRDELRVVSDGLKEAKRTRLLTTEMLQDIDRLPLLDAIIKETMRLRPPTPGPQRRVVPAGGVTVSDYYIPADTIISTSQRTVHRNKEAFPEPDLWKPERWMNKSTDVDLGDRDPNKWWWAFGSGAMSCSGKDFAVVGMLALTFVSHRV